MKARLAQKEYGEGTGISLKTSDPLGNCTLHGHDFYEIDIIIDGCAETVINGKSERAERGTVYFMTPEDFHEYRQNKELKVWNIQFFGDDVSSPLLRPLADGEKRGFTPDEKGFALICELYSVMQMSAANDDVAPQILPRLLESLLAVLAGCTSEDDEKRRTPPDIQTALVYIQEHFKENPPLASVAALLSLNERYFCTRFKKYTGRTYKDYLRRTKLRYARKLILSTDISMTEISEMCGYVTQSHFNREFKERYGVSPRELRKK